MNVEEFIELLRTFEGLSYAPATRAIYRDFIAPAEIETGRITPDAICQKSDCALAGRAAWRRAGVQHQILVRPYVDTQAVADIERIARDLDAWIAGAKSPPEPGDTVIIMNPWHVLIVLERDEDTGALSTWNGGEKDAKGFQSIKVIDRHLADGAIDGRPVYGRACGLKLFPG